MTTINPKALAPAVLVFRDEHAAYRTYADLRDSEAVSATVNILTAYLAALPAGDEAEVVKRAKSVSHLLCDSECRGRCTECPVDVVRDMAAVIERQSATIAQLRETNDTLNIDVARACETIAQLRGEVERLEASAKGDGWGDFNLVKHWIGNLIDDPYKERSMWPRLSRLERWWRDMKQSRDAEKARADKAEARLALVEPLAREAVSGVHFDEGGTIDKISRNKLGHKLSCALSSLAGIFNATDLAGKPESDGPQVTEQKETR